MPNINILKSNPVEDTYRNNYVKSKFDIDKMEISENFDINFEFPEKWNLGVIVGSSGTGKSTIANDLFKISTFKYGKGSIIDEIKIDKDVSVDEVISLFNKVGFSSPPSWLKPYHVLSNGQKMRVDLAQALLRKNEVICFDEFTSVVDREVAKIASMCISKYVKKEDKQFVAVSCHYDILEWLEPDWILDTSSMTFYKGKMSPNTKDLQSSSISENAGEKNGENLKSIII
jgi:ABC-type glutathione transport system ATPase component